MPVVYLDTKDFLFKSSRLIKNLSIIVILAFILSVLLFIVFLALGRVYKDAFGKIHYQVRYKQIDIVSIVSNGIAMILMIFIFYNYIQIFGFVRSKTLIGMIIFSSAILIIFVAQLLFLIINFCSDPNKIYNEKGECVCKNNLINIKGKCSCPQGYYLSEDSCVFGCRSSDDCQGNSCIGGFCCPFPNIECNNQCCAPDVCKKEGDTVTCCGSKERQCFNPKTGITECCDPQTTCINNACVTVCGPPDQQFLCSKGESCLQTNGDFESLKVFQSSFPPEQKSVISGGSLYTCVKPPECTLQSTPVFVPPPIANDKITFYPCYRTGEWEDVDASKIKPEDESKFTPLQLNICVPKEVDASFEGYQNCWKKIRGGEDSNIYDCEKDNDCDLLNIVKINYNEDSKSTEKINKAIKYEFLKTDDKGTFKGNYCGDGAVRIRSLKFSDSCKDVQDRTHAALQGGVFTNSRYVYFNDDICNSYFDCINESPNVKNSSGSDYFTSYNYNGKDNMFGKFSLSTSSLLHNASPIKSGLVDYKGKCPDQCTPVDKEIWPPESTQYCECPDDLKSLETPRTTDGSKYIYDTDLCTKSGYIVHEKNISLDLVCNDESSCRARSDSDNLALKNFSDNDECINYCQQVIFTNTWYNIDMCESGNTCDKKSQIQIKFDVAGDDQGTKIPVITQTDHYDISIRKQDGTDMTIYVNNLNGSSQKFNNGNKFMKSARIFYILSDQAVCATCSSSQTCGCDSGVNGDAPNDIQPNRELMKNDRFVFGNGTEGGYLTNQYWYLGVLNQGNSIFTPWTKNCDTSESLALYGNICITKKGFASQLEPYYLRFV